MSFETDADIAALLEGFRDRTLPKEKWTHAAHWAAALGLPATTGPDATRINLDDNHVLTFQEAAQTRLEGFCITIQNAMKALERADRLDLQSAGDGVRIGGVRLVLNNE